VVEEAVASGIEDIVIVTGAQKRAIEDHFDTLNGDLLKNLEKSGKHETIAGVSRIAQMANFIYVRQRGPYGNGTPVLAAEPIIGKEPFAVLWGDEFIHAEPPRLAQMMEVHQELGGIVISGVRIDRKEDLRRYGIADITPVRGNVYCINAIVEKPEPDHAPSNLATHGAYILPPEILDPGQGGEVWLVDAINQLTAQGVPMYAVEITNGRYYDTGNKLEYMKTVVELGLTHPEIGEAFRGFIGQLKL
jgi:UTP--glucose-1-phosphate uridylyltransferase